MPDQQQLDNMPYTYWSGVVLRRGRVRALAAARKQLIALLEQTAAKSTAAGERRYADVDVDGLLPLDFGAPMVCRGVRPHVQAEWDLLRQCEVTAQLLKTAQRKAPRELLGSVLRCVAAGKAGSQNVLSELGFVADDYVSSASQPGADAGAGGVEPRILARDEMRMIRHLAGSSHPRAVFAAKAPEEWGVNEEKFALYRIFGLRLQKILEDPSPECLFPDLNTRVTVEDLLHVMNAGADGPVRRTKFSVPEALKWLDRLHGKGRIR
jgi:hypothetical protein